VITSSGLRLHAEAIFSIQGITPQTRLGLQLGLDHTDQGYVVVDAEQKTSAEGVYACGDMTNQHSHQVAAAAHQGGQAACAANYFLYPHELTVS